MALDHFDVTRNTTKTVLNAQGVLETVPANVPGFEFNADGTYKGCLIEPSATNINTGSEDFSEYVKPPEIALSDGGLSGFGLPATRVVVTGDTGDRVGEGNGRVVNNNSLSQVEQDGQTYVLSAEVKVDPGFFLFVGWSLSNGNRLRARRIDSEGNNINASRVPVTTDLLSSITPTGNGFFLVTMITTLADSQIRRPFFVVSQSSDIGNNVTGDGTGGGWITRFDIKIDNTLTSYIPTPTNSTATRNADVIVRENAEDLIGQDEGTVFVEFESVEKTESTPPLFILGSTNDGFIFDWLSNNRIRFRSRDNGSTIGNFNVTLTQKRNKIAVVYTDTAYTLFLNGVEINTATRNVVNMDEIDIDGVFNAHLKTFALYKRALTEQEAISLTQL